MITQTAALESFRTLNNNGEGFAPASDADDINDCAELGTLIHAAHSAETVAVYEQLDGKVYAVANINGPWAVRIA
jgi:hypothetical protein